MAAISVSVENNTSKTVVVATMSPIRSYDTTLLEALDTMSLAANLSVDEKLTTTATEGTGSATYWITG
jgi:hypothetical protein